MKDVDVPTPGPLVRSLLPRPEAAIGWWFVHGQALAAPGGANATLRFMVAFFEVRSPAADRPACMLLAHVMAEDGRVLHRSSRMSPGIAEVHADIARRLVGARFPAAWSRFVLNRHMADVQRQAEALGVTVTRTEARIAPDRLALEWDDFAFEQAGAQYSLRLGLRGDEVLDLQLQPESCWLDDSGRVLDPGLAPPYRYVSCPRLALSGRIGGRPVGGRAWIDRQWGDFDNWFLTRSGKAPQLMGWDWAGLWLDNGCDLLAVRAFSLAPAGPSASGYAVLFGPEGPRRVNGWLEPLPGTLWISPASGIGYPLGQRLILPDQDAELRLLPIGRDQEIPVFGVPAIWEGAVRAEGRFGDRPVRGTGRLELFGYGYADTLVRYSLRRLRRGLRLLLAAGRR